ncbi:putative Intradiol ring-cleavage dioxygenase [Seiridium cardinale]|uniref:Intradiol ring-cleavage dioxygenase n=1 Tax=Seiridium cardinale TaxID=138064 RepID=A0ABR2XZY0_9PEZI
MSHKTFILTVLSLASLATAHSGEIFNKKEHMEELANTHAVAEVNAREFEICHSRPDIERRERAVARRAATFARLRKANGLNDDTFLHRREASSLRQWSANSRNKSSLKYTKDTPTAELFGSNASCILTPDDANGTYFVYQEHIRSNVVENVQGCPHAFGAAINRRKYVQASQRANRYLGGLATTYLRGVQPTDADGVVNFDTLFPGHLQGRATQQHIIAHVGSKVLDSGTYTGGQVAHLSQLFFDQVLIDTIEATAPYNTNRIAKTSNLADWFTGYAASPKYDPFPNYTMQGSGVSGGMFVWAELGTNISSNWDYYAPYASTWKERWWL